MNDTEILIAGGGTIGLSLALEMRSRGAKVTLIDAEKEGLASMAAAGMLACYDPDNDQALLPLSELSIQLYPSFLERITEWSGEEVAFQTSLTLQKSEEPAIRGTKLSREELHTLLPHVAPSEEYLLLQENSLDPRQLYQALRKAAQAAGVVLQQGVVTKVEEGAKGAAVHLLDERCITTTAFVDSTGAWSALREQAVRPVKGQVLRVRLTEPWLRTQHAGNAVLRTSSIYIVPRTDGTALIGATVEEGAGFDLSLQETTLEAQRLKAAELLPAIAHAPFVEAWSGLRPRAFDGPLPFLGAISEHCFASTAHFRNGILQAPATAFVMAELLTGNASPIDLTPFTPQRMQKL